MKRSINLLSAGLYLALIRERLVERGKVGGCHGNPFVGLSESVSGKV
jgi:hypothetical protein